VSEIIKVCENFTVKMRGINQCSFIVATIYNNYSSLAKVLSDLKHSELLPAADRGSHQNY
jgi:hypothetical protein